MNTITLKLGKDEFRRLVGYVCKLRDDTKPAMQQEYHDKLSSMARYLDDVYRSQANESHEHDIVIWDSYQIYATCSKCGMHDWGEEFYKDGNEATIEDFKKKYPEHKIEEMDL